MARPQRNNVDYFPFLCEEGKKMYYLEETYGNDGFATFVKILRELAKTDYHYLDLSKASTTMFLSAKCKVSKDVLDAIISDLVDLEKFDAILWDENRIIWCQDFVDSIQDAYSKRTNNCIEYNSLLVLLDSLGVRKLSKRSSKPSKGNRKGDGNPQSIVKDSKEDNSIDKLYKLYPTVCPIQNRPLSKGQKAKDKLKILLKDHTYDYLESVIKGYLTNSKLGNSFLKDFTTFLNNLPDLEELRQSWAILEKNNPNREETREEKLARLREEADKF